MGRGCGSNFRFGRISGREGLGGWLAWAVGGLARGKIVLVCGAERAAVYLDKRPKGLIPGTEHKSKT